MKSYFKNSYFGHAIDRLRHSCAITSAEISPAAVPPPPTAAGAAASEPGVMICTLMTSAAAVTDALGVWGVGSFAEII